jgi:hypothetical protein
MVPVLAYARPLISVRRFSIVPSMPMMGSELRNALNHDCFVAYVSSFTMVSAETESCLDRPDPS